MFIEHKTVAYVAVFLFAHKDILSFLFDISYIPKTAAGAFRLSVYGKLKITRR